MATNEEILYYLYKATIERAEAEDFARDIMLIVRDAVDEAEEEEVLSW